MRPLKRLQDMEGARNIPFVNSDDKEKPQAQKEREAMYSQKYFYLPSSKLKQKEKLVNTEILSGTNKVHMEEHQDSQNNKVS